MSQVSSGRTQLHIEIMLIVVSYSYEAVLVGSVQCEYCLSNDMCVVPCNL